MSKTRGFTLVEVTFGLAVASLALLLAAALFGEVTDRGRSLRKRLIEIDQRGVGIAWLGAAIESLQVGLTDDDVFAGRTERLDFTSRLQTPAGWF